MLEALAGAALTYVLSRLPLGMFPSTAKCRRKKLLKTLLTEKRFTQGRSLEELTLKTGMPASECRNLLAEIGAEGIKLRDGREGWRLRSGKQR